MATFGTALSCIDGRIQGPVSRFLLEHFEVTYLDTVTRAGIIKHLTSAYDPATRAIVDDLEASITKHASTNLALVAHVECAGNPVDDAVQLSQIEDSVEYFRRRYPSMDVIGLWVGDSWTAQVVP